MERIGGYGEQRAGNRAIGEGEGERVGIVRETMICLLFVPSG